MTPTEYLTRKQYAYFDDLPLTTNFSLHGNQWRKRSSRTAEIITPEQYRGFWAYFRNNEVCLVGRHTGL